MAQSYRQSRILLGMGGLAFGMGDLAWIDARGGAPARHLLASLLETFKDVVVVRSERGGHRKRGIDPLFLM